MTGKKRVLVVAAIMLAGCHQRNNILYGAQNCIVYANRIIWVKNESRIISPTPMKSDYQSRANNNFPNIIGFKCAIHSVMVRSVGCFPIWCGNMNDRLNIAMLDGM